MQSTSFVILALLTLAAAALAADGPQIGDPAPDFELKDSRGKSYRLSEFKGKSVVLEFIRSGSW